LRKDQRNNPSRPDIPSTQEDLQEEAELQAAKDKKAEKKNGKK
jgi:hypothetical protein